MFYIFTGPNGEHNKWDLLHNNCARSKFVGSHVQIHSGSIDFAVTKTLTQSPSVIGLKLSEEIVSHMDSK